MRMIGRQLKGGKEKVMQFLSLKVILTNFASTTLVLTLVYRLVCSQLLSPPFFPSPSKAFSQIHKTPQHSISAIFIIYSPIPLPNTPRLIHPNFLHRNSQSWLTHSGF